MRAGKIFQKHKNTLLWRFVQDHEDKNLMFLGTEFGVYFTNNGGEKWIDK